SGNQDNPDVKEGSREPVSGLVPSLSKRLNLCLCPMFGNQDNPDVKEGSREPVSGLVPSLSKRLNLCLCPM
ncbi:hypothetical protein CRUP_038020, partial [Coryphaenoides rupestris]